MCYVRLLVLSLSLYNYFELSSPCLTLANFSFKFILLYIYQIVIVMSNMALFTAFICNITFLEIYFANMRTKRRVICISSGWDFVRPAAALSGVAVDCGVENLSSLWGAFCPVTGRCVRRCRGRVYGPAPLS